MGVRVLGVVFVVQLVVGVLCGALPKGLEVRHASPHAPWNFDILVDGVVMLSSHNVYVRNGDVTYMSKPEPNTPIPSLPGKVESLILQGSDSISDEDRFGKYEGIETKWIAGNKPVVTSVRTYAGNGMVIYRQSFPDGLNGTSVNDMNAVSSGFPNFAPASTSTSTLLKRRWMAYNGWDCKAPYGCVTSQAQRVSMGLWDNSTSLLPQGIEGSGPLVIMDPVLGVSAVVSGGSSFMAQSQQLIPSAAPQFPTPSPPPSLSSFSAHPGQYCNTGNKCASFEYSPGWPRPQPYCFNCRVLDPNTPCRLTESGQNYTSYQRTIPVEQHILSYGLLGTISSVPVGFSFDVVVTLGKGPNDAVREWGTVLSTAYNKTNPRNKDFTTTHLGYDTDNGAYYYYNPEQDKTYDQTLMDVHSYAKNASIPYKHVQLDSWWYIKGAGDGVKTWSPAPNTFPDGLASFRQRSGWKITAHNRMWAADTTYAKQNGGKFTWIIEGSEAVPVEQAFWDWLLADAAREGIYVYEQDWLFNEFIGTNATLSSATLATKWLNQMAKGAEDNDMVIQYCMLWPRMALQSLEYPAVTTARASTDYHAGGNDQWIMGLSSLFLDSLQLRPTKDNFFSTDKQPTIKKGVEKFNRLQAIVSTLSTGPVFPSDAVGCSDVELIMRSCTASGLLLRPDRAATNIDSNILAKALARGTGQDEPGEIQSTLSSVALTGDDTSTKATFFYLLAAQTNATQIHLSEITQGSAWNSYVGFEFNSSSTIKSLAQTSQLQLPLTDRWTFQYWTFCPVLKNGFAFLGEAGNKWVAVSQDRFDTIAESADGLTVSGSGSPSEEVTLAWVKTTAESNFISSVETMSCTVPSSGKFVATIPDKTCQ